MIIMAQQLSMRSKDELAAVAAVIGEDDLPRSDQFRETEQTLLAALAYVQLAASSLLARHRRRLAPIVRFPCWKIVFVLRASLESRKLMSAVVLCLSFLRLLTSPSSIQTAQLLSLFWTSATGSACSKSYLLVDRVSVLILSKIELLPLVYQHSLQPLSKQLLQSRQQY